MRFTILHVLFTSAVHCAMPFIDALPLITMVPLKTGRKYKTLARFRNSKGTGLKIHSLIGGKGVIEMMSFRCACNSFDYTVGYSINE